MVLTHLLLLHSGYKHIRYNSLERVFEENKGDLLLAMRASQGNIGTDGENFQDWILFFLRCLKKQKDGLVRKVEQELLGEQTTAFVRTNIGYNKGTRPAFHNRCGDIIGD